MAAKQINVSPWTYRLWEQGVHEPSIYHWPAVIHFLGYDPSGTPETLGEHILGWRRVEGLSRSRLAASLSIDERSLWLLEIDAYKIIDPRVRDVVEFLNDRFHLTL
tara:strand:+ start:27867 stop:28184 length:318 start_codon:yes stop_codon:yes gene_type:complete